MLAGFPFYELKASSWFERHGLDVVCEAVSKDGSLDKESIVWLWNDMPVDDLASDLMNEAQLDPQLVFENLSRAVKASQSMPSHQGVGYWHLKNHSMAKANYSQRMPLKLMYQTPVTSKPGYEAFMVGKKSKHKNPSIEIGSSHEGVVLSYGDLSYEVRKCFATGKELRSSKSQALIRDSLAKPHLKWQCALKEFTHSSLSGDTLVFDQNEYLVGPFKLSGTEIKACRTWHSKNQKKFTP